MQPRTSGAIHTSDRADRAAHRMRLAPTIGEKNLWKLLRKLEGLHFRRQAPFGPYVADFASHGARLIVEVDGPLHALGDQPRRDVERDAWLTGRGYRVLRFSDKAVRETPTSAIDAILAKVGETPPPPSPPRKGEGG